MSAPFRITRPKVRRVDAGKAEGAKDYLDRLTNLIPTEVISAYLIGKGVLVSGDTAETPVSYWVGWTIFGFVLVVISRLFGTADPKENQSPQLIAVMIACVSYVVWIYSMGDVFALLNLYKPQLGVLIMVGWTALTPFLYKGS